MSLREEYFTAFCEGKEECLCRIIMPSDEWDSAAAVFAELYDRVRNVCESGKLVGMHERMHAGRDRFAVTPYRYVCKGSIYRIDAEIISCKIEASLDARFPGGMHLSGTDGFLYDERLGMLIPTEVLPLSDIRHATKKKGKPTSTYADADGIHFLFSDTSECLCPTERFIALYKSIRKYILRAAKKEKKGIDKRREL